MLQLIHTCDISRNVSVGTNGRRSLESLATGVACLALPMNTAAELANKFDIGRGYNFYFAPTQDVKVGDVFSRLGDTYTAKAVHAYDVPVVGHKRVMARQEIGS